MSNLATPWPTNLPPLPDVLKAAARERAFRRNVYAKKVKADTMTPQEARHQYDCCRAWELLTEAEIRRGQPWPPLSPTPAAMLEWLERQVREAKRNGREAELPFLNVVRWLVLADVHERLPAHEFDSPTL